MGNRYSAVTDEPTILEFEFRKNSILTDAYSINKVTIHASSSDAENNVNILFTLDSEDILHTAVGSYSYTVPIISTVGTYYDKIFLTPINGGAEVSYVSSYNITAPVFTGKALEVSSNPNLCRITGRTTDANGNILRGVLIFCRPWAMPGTLANNFIGQDGVSSVSDANGEFYIDLYKNTEFIITIKEMGVHSVIKIPDKSTFPLVSLMAGEVVTPPTDPGDTNW